MSLLSPEQSHDQNIKTLIVENPWAAITFAMPKCANFFRHEPELEPIREETLKTLFSDSFLRMDVPLLAKYEKLAFTFLVEHQHDPSKFSIHVLSRYVSHLEEQYERDVIPIVYFPNASARNKSLKRVTKSTFLGKRYHYFTYEAVLLKGMPAEKYLKSNNIIARLMLPFMRYSRQALMEVLDSGIKGVLEMVDPAKGLRRAKYLEFLFHYFNVGKKEWEEYAVYKRAKNEEQEIGMVSNVFQQIRIEEGQKVLLMLLPKKLGPMPPEIEKSIRGLADVERINSILNRVLEIRDWQEIKQLIN